MECFMIDTVLYQYLIPKAVTYWLST